MIPVLGKRNWFRCGWGYATIKRAQGTVRTNTCVGVCVCTCAKWRVWVRVGVCKGVRICVCACECTQRRVCGRVRVCGERKMCVCGCGSGSRSLAQGCRHCEPQPPRFSRRRHPCPAIASCRVDPAGAGGARGRGPAAWGRSPRSLYQGAASPRLLLAGLLAVPASPRLLLAAPSGSRKPASGGRSSGGPPGERVSCFRARRGEAKRGR